MGSVCGNRSTKLDILVNTNETFRNSQTRSPSRRKTTKRGTLVLESLANLEVPRYRNGILRKKQKLSPSTLEGFAKRLRDNPSPSHKKSPLFSIDADRNFLISKETIGLPQSETCVTKKKTSRLGIEYHIKITSTEINNFGASPVSLKNLPRNELNVVDLNIDKGSM